MDSLLSGLLSALGSGSLSCERIRQFGSAAPPSAGLRDLAALNAHNVERDLHRWAARQPWRQLLPDLYSYEVMVRDSDLQERSAMRSCILPHELFSSLFQNARPVFNHLVTGGDQNLQEWWAAAAVVGDSWFQENPVIQQASDPRLLVPIGLHGDEAGMHGDEPVLVVTWNPLSSTQGTIDNRFLFGCLRSAEVIKPETMQTFWSVLVWSVKALSSGVFPSHDHRGMAFGPGNDPARAKLANKPLAGGLRGVWAELRGDWKFLRESLNLSQHYGSNLCCHLCAASKKNPETLYTDFRRDAGHRQTLVNPQQWLMEQLARPIHSPLLELPGFNLFRVAFDIMHCVDLGLLQSFIPSALWELTNSAAPAWPGDTRTERFAAAFADYKRWCRQNNVLAGIRSTKWRPEDWRKSNTSYPRISQQTAKGAALRSMQYWVFQVCSRPQQLRDNHGHLRAALFSGLVQLDVLYRRASRHLTLEERTTAAEAAEQALVAANALASESLREGTKLWKLIPKCHALQHIAMDNPLNARMQSCYSDEDMMGRTKRIFSACHASTAGTRALQRYAILVGLRWWALLGTLTDALVAT